MSASPHFPKLPASWSEHSLQIPNDQTFVRIYAKNEALDRNKTAAVRLLFVVHGQAEQSDRYEHFPSYLRSCVDVVAILDLPGHGKSSGVRGHIENFEQYSNAALNAFKATQAWVQQRNALGKSYWFGHSLGGLITLRTLLKHHDLALNSVAVSASLLDLAFPVPVVKKNLAVLFEPLIGKIKLWNELDARKISHDMSVVEHYEKNPLNHKYVTPRFFVNLQKEMAETRSHTGPFSYPLLLLVPLADEIVSWKAQYNFFKNLKMANGKIKEMTTFPGYFHEPFNELGKERPFSGLESWLSRF